MGRNVLVFGGTSYLGTLCINELLRRGYQVAVFIRNESQPFLLRDALPAVRLVNAETWPELRNITAILSFGFVKRYSSYYDALSRTEAYFKFLAGIARAVVPELVVHISSLAVFEGSREIRPTAVTRYSRNAYADSKILAESTLCEQLSSTATQLCIVRLGNLMGEGAPNWTGSIVDRLLNLTPFTCGNNWGYSNVTYCWNVTSYILHLLEKSSNRRLYHHLAEFSSVTWDKWIYPIAEILGIDASYVTVPAPAAQDVDKSASLTNELLKAIARNRPLKNFAKELSERASYFGFIRKKIEHLKQRVPCELAVLQDRCNISTALEREISTSREFHSVLDSSWSTPFSFDDAISRIIRSLDGSIY